jgi:hypothetical protein
LLAGLPLAWLLSYAAALPFYLGLFFFALFGLIIGAVAFRLAAPGGPYGRWTVFAGTTVLVVACFGLTVVKESRDFPDDMADEALKRARDIGPRTAAQYRAEVADSVRSYLRERHPPGGTLGYIHWKLTEAEIKKGSLPLADFVLRPPQARWTWAIRIVLSIALLAFGIASQTFPMSKENDRPLPAPGTPSS